MEIKTIVTVIIAGMLGAVVFTATLPVWEGLEESQTITYTNSYGTRASLLDLTGSHTITSDGITITIDDGDPITVANYQMGLASDLFNGRRFGSNIQWPSIHGNAVAGDIDLTIDNGLLNGTITSIGGTVRTFEDEPIKYLAYPDTAGDYTMMFSDSDNRRVWLTDPDSEFYSANYINTTSEWFSYYDGVLTVDGSPNDSMVFDGEKVDYDTSVYQYNISADDIVFTVDNDGEPYIVHPYVCVVPYHVYGMATQGDHIVITLISLLPVLVAIGLIVGIAGAIFIKRM